MMREYLAYGFIRLIPYMTELEGILFLVDGISKKDFVKGSGGAALYIMGKELNNLIKENVHLPKKSKLETSAQDA